MPKLNTFKKYNFTAQAFNYTTTVDGGNNTTKNYFFLRKVSFDITQGILGKMTLIFPEDAFDLMQNAQLQSVTDKHGNDLYPNSVWTLQGFIPIINNFGEREGFRTTAVLDFTTVGV